MFWRPSSSIFWYSFSSFWLLQKGSIGLCGWSSLCHHPPMRLWQSERSSSWTLASRSKHSSTPPGSTDIKHQCHKLDCCCRLQSTCLHRLLTFVSVFKSITACGWEQLSSAWTQSQSLWSPKSNDLTWINFFFKYFFLKLALKYFCAAMIQHCSII